MAASLFWKALSGPAGNTVGLLNAQGQPPIGAQAAIVDPAADIVYPAPGGGLLRVAVGGGAASQLSAVGDGQLVYWDNTAGQWVATATTPPSDGYIARWNATTRTYDFVLESVAGALQYFDTSFSPVGRWNFNNTLVDAGGVALNDLTLTAGSTGFCDVVPGKVGLYVYSGARYETAGVPTALQLTGNMSLFAIVQTDNTPAAEQPVARYTGTGETQAANTLWSLSYPTQSSPAAGPKRLQYLSEHGAGVDDLVTSAGNASLPPLHNIALIGWTRIANVIQFYYNGLPFGPAAAAITTPDGGTDPTCRLYVGANTNGTTATAPFVLFSMQVIASGLTPAQVKQVYNQSLGPAFGRLT